MLAISHFGDPSDLPPILIAHGLFGSARNWNVIAKRMSETRQVISVDMRNHGQSPWENGHEYADLAADLAEVIGTLGGQADIVGHSMGGKASMALALLHPEQVRRLVVADIAPVPYGHTQVQLIHAMRALDLSKVETRRDADEALQATVPEDGVRAFLLQSLDVKGRAWRLNLDVLETFMPKIIGWPEIAGQFDGPTLFLSGAASDYVRPEHRDPIRALFPAARFAKIPGAGHWLHADKPREFEATVAAYLNA
ncbi:alpha/beta fold hydrolase [Roseobacter sp. HKCCD9010]|uniref:alpha/beta fold hydrolase n=1 Tax=unclassified Roseobacter TaxID=196798 RepID=UPI0014925C21|nr:MULTISPECIES: alpha/beta fold hydrolase [unclassified Roseobacter]MBF9051452.1 alpha/beta fold hydrolase [Rhodobacterales bacterium HKCCD4356]NNV12976.1 alpha/beta fold hydrolase [Roseobacter sp. HKCCD7357]NNV17227.1 alpha/beta fold hydrolase [Roseobacter sp. HKCCD8768]NNV26833.1 alpha/beta fold hydrolase [Roseobacter sp. HKCCD8192]NNV30953.1 alpha/beta fold hydrolase [Roseobacter sp. HKCCD9061]